MIGCSLTLLPSDTDNKLRQYITKILRWLNKIITVNIGKYYVEEWWQSFKKHATTSVYILVSNMFSPIQSAQWGGFKWLNLQSCWHGSRNQMISVWEHPLCKRKKFGNSTESQQLSCKHASQCPYSGHCLHCSQFFCDWNIFSKGFEGQRFWFDH